MNRLGLILVALFVAGWMLFTTLRNNAATAVTAIPDPVVDEKLSPRQSNETIVLAGGCFWGIQEVFQHVKGVSHVTAGYSGGTLNVPTYEDVSSGTSGHAESVEIVYDPSKITLGQLLKIFFSVAHDPTELNRQGPDTGTQYRSAIFFANEEQKRIALAYIEQLNKRKLFSGPIVTETTPFKEFFPAEEYHQNYAAEHPNDAYIVRFDLPKVKHLEENFPSLYR